jgi:hypothetical protein
LLPRLLDAPQLPADIYALAGLYEPAEDRSAG